tara:strand:+ start:3999 stop:5051 length:1053 start_codon:yes stop_codon:yes gene_type:complete
MNSDLWPIVTCVVGVFLVISVGAFCRQQGWLTREADQSLARLTANVLLPCLFLDRILWGDDLAVPAAAGAAAWIPPIVGFLTTASGFALGLLFARTLGRLVGLDTDAKQRSFALCVGICNYGYIPLPLAIEFYPQAVVDLIMHNVGVDLALWSIGIAVIAGVTRPSSGALESGASVHRPVIKRAWYRAFLSPPLLAVAVATLIKQVMSPTVVPGVVQTAVSMLGECTIPMGLLLSGAIIIDFIRDATWAGSIRVVLSGILLRQGIFPALMLVVGAGLMGATFADEPDANANLRVVVMLQAAMPAAVFPIVLVRMYDRDTTTALRVVLPTSLAGIVLIPLWLGIGKWWLGV